MSKVRLKQEVKLVPFSKKYTEYYMRCLTNRVNCLEGAYRAGKSVINIMSFANHLDHCEDKLHLVSGYSSASARLNVSDCNGLGLKYLFDGRCRTGKYENNDCLYIRDMQGRTKIVIFVGGGTSISYKTIQGLSFGSWLSVELMNLYVSEDETNFINMALNRLTQSKDQKIWWDLNPEYETHKVYKKYLDVYAKQQSEGIFPGGYNYMKCSLFDNNALTEEQLANALANYPVVDSVDYRRYILGDRAASEGVIFTDFALNSEKYIVSSAKTFLNTVNAQFISVGVDFGGNGSDTTFVATLLCNNYQKVFILYSDKIDMSKPDNVSHKVFEVKFLAFLKQVCLWDIAPIRCIFCDCADQVMKNCCKEVKTSLMVWLGTQTQLSHATGGISVENSNKGKINDRIKAKKLMMAQNNYHVFRKAETVIESTKTQIWNPKEGHEDERLDNGTCDIDTADAEEYSWSGFISKIIARNTR